MSLYVFLVIVELPFVAASIMHRPPTLSETTSIPIAKSESPTVANKFAGSSQGHDIEYLKQTRDINGFLPEEWKHICDLRFEYVFGSNFTAKQSFLLSCELKDQTHWSLHTYRKWISDNEGQLRRIIPREIDLYFAVMLKCYDSSTASLPWPFKARYLWYMTVDNCRILDYLKEFNATEPDQNYLNVIEITNSVLENSVQQFLQTLMNYKNRTRQYDCGPENAEKIVFSNVSKTFSGIPDVVPQQSNKTVLFDTFSSINQDSQRDTYRCSYKFLRYLDESRSSSVAMDHVQLFTENADLSALEYYNFSHSRLRDMKLQFLEWRRYFPKMKYLDLSHNRIRYISGISDKGLSTDPVGVIDLRHNNITSLSKDDINTLKFQSETVFIDIRNNPISCDCKLSDLMATIQNRSSVLLEKYDYILDMKCVSPASLAGRKLSQLNQEFCEFIEVFSLMVPVIILSCGIAFLIIVLIIVIRYRKEIMILAFTRLHISLPCREVVKADKRYDAFICYSEHDMKWVIYTLLPRLEERDNGPGFRLCIHHRDFPVGETIFDNICSKVKESSHTVLVLSNHFLRSTWCKCEFWAAFTESLTEKKRHLIMIITEDLDGELMDPTLKSCLKTFTYVRLDDRLFWDKIIFSLSDKKKDKENENNRGRNGLYEVNDNPGRNNAIEMNEKLDGLNNNRNIREVAFPDDIHGEEVINDIQRDGHINILDNDRNDEDIRNNVIIGKRNVLNHNELLQDGEWIL